MYDSGKVPLKARGWCNMMFGDVVYAYTLNFEIACKWRSIGINSVELSSDRELLRCQNRNREFRFILVEIRWKYVIWVKFSVTRII